MDELMQFTPKCQLVNDYTEINQPRFPVIDSHVHLCGKYRHEQYWGNYDLDRIISGLKSIGVRHIVDLELYSKKHWDFAYERTREYREYISLCAPIDFSPFERGEIKKIIDEMYYYYEKGACGYKVWKELGTTVKNSDGKVIPINAPCLSQIWSVAAKLELPIVIHIGDPPSFYEPVDMHNERYIELIDNPKWRRNPNGYTYQETMHQMEDLLKKNAKTVFVVAHMAAAPHDLNYVDYLMKNNSNLYIDIAAVLSELGRQPRRFKRFAEKYSSRLLFGTDYFAGDEIPHIPYYRFLETEDEYFPYTANGQYTQGLWNIYGCKLTSKTLKKIYSENAERIFKICNGGNDNE